jgi:hypothetical protein
MWLKSVIRASGAILQITPFITPTLPSLIPKSVIREITGINSSRIRLGIQPILSVEWRLNVKLIPTYILNPAKILPPAARA